MSSRRSRSEHSCLCGPQSSLRLIARESCIYKPLRTPHVNYINLDVEKQNHNSGKLIDYTIDLSSFKTAISSIGKNCKIGMGSIITGDIKNNTSVIDHPRKVISENK